MRPEPLLGTDVILPGDLEQDGLRDILALNALRLDGVGEPIQLQYVRDRRARLADSIRELFLGPSVCFHHPCIRRGLVKWMKVLSLYVLDQSNFIRSALRYDSEDLVAAQQLVRPKPSLPSNQRVPVRPDVRALDGDRLYQPVAFNRRCELAEGALLNLLSRLIGIRLNLSKAKPKDSRHVLRRNAPEALTQALV